MTDVRTRRLAANGMSFQIDEAGEGDDVALLLHGFPESRRCWGHQLPALASLGWRAVAPDLRGYGGSSRPLGRAAYRMEHLIADAEALFDALGARRRLLIGHDWGGVIAWSFAIRQARQLDGLVILNAPHPAVFHRVIRTSWRQRWCSWYMLFFQLPWLPERMLSANRAAAVARALRKSAKRPDTFPPDIIDHYRHNAAAPGAMTAMLSYYRANLRDLGTGPSAQVAAPTLLLWAEEDVALGQELVAPTAGYVPDLTIHRLPGVSHWVQEEAPAEVNKALAAWLRQRALAT
jgi:pimeloyl-ACP methyl ester carboxylesterase